MYHGEITASCARDVAFGARCAQGRRVYGRGVDRRRGGGREVCRVTTSSNDRRERGDRQEGPGAQTVCLAQCFVSCLTVLKLWLEFQLGDWRLCGLYATADQARGTSETPNGSRSADDELARGLRRHHGRPERGAAAASSTVDRHDRPHEVAPRELRRQIQFDASRPGGSASSLLNVRLWEKSRAGAAGRDEVQQRVRPVRPRHDADDLDAHGDVGPAAFRQWSR